MKFPKQFNFYKLFVISAIVIGVGGFLFYLISPRLISDEPEMKIPEQEREEVFESPRQSTVQSPKPPSEAEIEKAIAALESLGPLEATEHHDEEGESLGDETNSETLLTDSGDRTPLSYEEERKQREERIRNSPEYKALKAKNIELALEMTEWSTVGTERPAYRAHIAYMRNPFSVFGMTEVEADEIEWPDDELKFMREEGKRLRQESEASYAQWEEVWDELVRQRLEMSRQIGDLFKEEGQ